MPLLLLLWHTQTRTAPLASSVVVGAVKVVQPYTGGLKAIQPYTGGVKVGAP